MADNVIADLGTGGAKFATDEIATIHYPLNKLGFGALDSFTIVSASDGLPVELVAGTAEIGNITNSGAFAVQIDGINGTVDVNNNSSTPLAGGATFTGTSTDILQFSGITISVFSDVASATDGLSVQFSADGTNWDHTDVFTIPAATGKTFSFQPVARFMRVLYTNGGSAQATFRLSVILKTSTGKSSSHRIADSISAQDDAEVVKAVLTGENPSNQFVNFQSTMAGNFKVSLEESNGDVTGSGTEATAIRVTEASDSAALTSLQLIDDPVFADDAAFTLASSKTMVAGVIRDDNTSLLSAAEGDVVPLRVDQSGHLHVHSHLFDPGTIDGLGHILMNEAVNQIEIQFFRDTPANLLTVTTAGGGATSQVGGAGKFETSTAGTANAKGVTALSTSYRSASEIFTFFSVIFTTPTDGNGFQRIGLYDDNNGVFLGFEGTTFGVSIRNAASDTQTVKASFSEDSLTGATGSLFTRAGVPEAIDLTKFNLFRIRYGWFGSAPIFYEVLSPDDHWVTFHVIRQPNNALVASMENPDLPMTVHVSKTAADATNLIMLTNCWAAGVTTGAIPLNATLTDANLAKVVRTVIAGKTPGGAYVNIETTAGGNLKMSVQEISDGLDIGAGNAGAETQRVSISSDDVNMSAIKTAVEAAIIATTDSISAALQTNQIMNGTTSLIPKFAVIDTGASGDNTLVAAVTAKKIRVLQVTLIATAAVNVRFESGAAGTALTGQMALTANSGFEASFCPVGLFETASGVLLNLELSSAVPVDGWLVYVEV